MKHLLSLVAALAATAALLLALPGAARASIVASTTADPNPSGYATCNGTNANGTAATWTVGGHIYFTSDYSNPPAHVSPGGYHNIKPASSGNPYDGSGGSPCEFKTTTSNDILPGCATITSSADIYSTPYGGGSNPPQHVSTATIAGPVANRVYDSLGAYLGFTELDDVNYVQYKVKSSQSGQTLGQAATPYL